MSLDNQQQAPCAIVSGRPASLKNDIHLPHLTMTAASTPIPVLSEAMPECLDEDPLFQTSVSWLDCRRKRQPRRRQTLQPPEELSRCLTPADSQPNPVADREPLSWTLILVIAMDN